MKFLRTLSEAILASAVLVSPALAQVGGYIPPDPPLDQGGPLPVLGAGLPVLVVLGGGYVVARLLKHKRD